MIATSEMIRDKKFFSHEVMRDKGFMAWLRSHEPDWKTLYWQRNVAAMYLAYNAGKEAGRK